MVTDSLEPGGSLKRGDVKRQVTISLAIHQRPLWGDSAAPSYMPPGNQIGWPQRVECGHHQLMDLAISAAPSPTVFLIERFARRGGVQDSEGDSSASELGINSLHQGQG